MEQQNLEPKVGIQIRQLRERQHLSLRALAERCGLSINAISQIERGENSPTVGTLHRLARAFNVPITDLFHDGQKQVAVFVKRNAGLRAQSHGISMESLGIGLENQQLEPFKLEIEVGKGNVEELITHAGEEFVHCLNGELECKVGEQTFHLEAGDSLLFEAGQQHSYHNPGNQKATLLLVCQAAFDRPGVRQLHLEAQ